MRALKAAVIVMGVLIVAGVVTIVVTIVQRTAGSGAPSAGGTTAQATLNEPEGTQIAGTSLSGDRLALQLQGGGAGRVVVLDTRTGHVLLRATLAH